MIKPCIIGLGYVGLPILLNLSKKYNSTGYDNNLTRIKDLKKGIDIFKEYNRWELKNKKIFLTNKIENIKKSNLYIITVPTPILKNKKPDLTHLKDVCVKLSKVLKKNDIIIFESTVYPGLTNNFCVPLLEKYNSLKINIDFFVGYSPERVNPGDKNHKLEKINKILAYPNSYRKKELISLYSKLGKSIIFTKNIVEAETAKVIENIQRDVNIGLINEIYSACKKLNINFDNVYKLASTKWNFLNFRPGLVGGHCLPVDPYYFSYICKKNKFNTKITLAGRKINDSMLNVIIYNIKKKLKNLKLQRKKKIIICGLTYKKDVADLRNSLSLKIFKKLKNQKFYGYDPLINEKKARKEGIITNYKKFSKFDVYIVLTEHSLLSEQIKKLKKKVIIYPI
ncbi:nucleotide sugar dehydrogenase [Candidatus Pelagibacter sp.]|nr:nucleotide sugar dehydrogenase [Candidatus Pelagibacter sp.]